MTYKGAVTSRDGVGGGVTSKRISMNLRIGILTPVPFKYLVAENKPDFITCGPFH